VNLRCLATISKQQVLAIRAREIECAASQQREQQLRGGRR